jgi:hypothetical protein
MTKLINEREDLFKREKRVKFELLVCRLIQFSDTDIEPDNATQDNLQDICDQWFFTGAEIQPNSTCLCGQGEGEGEEVKYVTYLRNRRNGYVARIGSSCIKKFGEDNQIQKEVALLLPLMKNHSIRVNSELAELMAKQKIITQLESAFIKELGQRRKLEQDSIDVLSVLKAKIAIEKIPPSVLAIADWIEDFIKSNPDNPEFFSPYDNRKVTVSRRLVEEYRELRKKLLVADASEYEKQTIIRVLGKFYSHKLNITPEPSRERPNIEQCQLEKSQVNQCNADELINLAKRRVDNYIESSDKRNIKEERETYTVLSVLLDAYHRFNGVAYNVDLLDGLQDSLARLELEIEKIPSVVRDSFSKTETSLRSDLYQRLVEIENEIKQQYTSSLEELQQLKEDLVRQVSNTISSSKGVLGGIELELERLKQNSNDLAVKYALKIQSLEKSIQDSLSQKDEQIDFLQRATDANKYDISELRRSIYTIESKSESNESNIYDLERKTESLEESIEYSQLNIDDLNRKMDEITGNLKRKLEIMSSDLSALSKDNSNNKEWIKTINLDLISTKSDIKDKWLITVISIITITIFFAIISWIDDSRLKRLEMNEYQRKNQPSLPRNY